MKVVILAGGYGTRLSEETYVVPKPMVEIGGMPILWHIIKYYSHFGFADFVVCLGYKSYVVKEYFCNYWLRQSDVTVNITQSGTEMTCHKTDVEDWAITLADTGMDAQTGLRIKRIQKYIGDERFMLTYGDGLSDVNLDALIKQHIQSGKIMTMTAVQPQGRFGAVKFDSSNTATNFNEKGKSTYINAGFMVMEPEIFEYLGKNEPLEQSPMETLAEQGKLGVYVHRGFWKCMDNLSDKNILEGIWKNEDTPPWKVWDN